MSGNELEDAARQELAEFLYPDLFRRIKRARQRIEELERLPNWVRGQLKPGEFPYYRAYDHRWYAIKIGEAKSVKDGDRFPFGPPEERPLMDLFDLSMASDHHAPNCPVGAIKRLLREELA